MKETRRNLMVGLFVLVGLFTLGGLIVMFGRGPRMLAGADVYRLHIRFDQASGIRPGTLVTVGGITVGSVEKVSFKNVDRFDQGVSVIAAIESEYRLPKGSRAVTIEPGLAMGRPPIRIIPGLYGEQWLGDGSEISGEIRGAVESLLPPAIVRTFERTATQIGDAAAALTPALEDIHQILQPRKPADVDRPGGPVGNMSSAMARLDGTLKNFNTVLGDPELQSHLKDAIENFHTLSEDGKAAVADMRAAASDARQIATDAKTMISNGNAMIVKLDERIDQVARATLDDLETAGRALDQLSALVQMAARGEGTIGKLFADDRLYESMVLTAKRLGETIDEYRLLAKEWQKGTIRVSLN